MLPMLTKENGYALCVGTMIERIPIQKENFQTKFVTKVLINLCHFEEALRREIPVTMVFLSIGEIGSTTVSGIPRYARNDNCCSERTLFRANRQQN